MMSVMFKGGTVIATLLGLVLLTPSVFLTLEHTLWRRKFFTAHNARTMVVIAIATWSWHGTAMFVYHLTLDRQLIAATTVGAASALWLIFLLWRLGRPCLLGR